MKVIKQTRFRKLLQFCILFAGIISMLFCTTTASANQRGRSCVVRGTIKDTNNQVIEYATVYIKGTTLAVNSDEKGEYFLRVMPGKHIVCAQLMGYTTFEKEIELKPEERIALNITLSQEQFQLDEVEVVAVSPVQQINKSAYNAIAIDAKALQNTTLDLANAMEKVSGVKLRESGGLGSDLQFSLNGFTGRHIKFFLDGVPMEGMGSSFQINNIPINMAERIEIYKGVVPVGFGGDAIGGAINIVTNQSRRTYVDASYSYGSFNTHRTSVNAGYTSKQGVMFELNAFQNYSDNTYTIYNAVKDFELGGTDTDKVEKIKRFHDTYHNETLIAKVGLVKKSFADRLVFGINVGKSYKDIQNGVRQNIVYGQKHNKGESFMPSLQYAKRDLFVEGLNVNLTANYNKNLIHNVDTSVYEYNWRGEKNYTGSLGEQNYQNSEYQNKNWNTTFTSHYILNELHSFTLNNVFSSYDRSTRASVSEATLATDTMPKASHKNVLGLDYKFNYKETWNVSVFGKHYLQYSKGPRNISTTSSAQYETFEETFTALGYGIAGTYFWGDFQAKVSYEKAYRLPTDSELFGNEDLEQGSTDLKAENSDNYNINLSFNKTFNRTHYIFVDAGFMLRNTKDYIRRVTEGISGGLFVGTHVNHGYVRNKSFNGEVRYGYKNIVSVDMNVTSQNIRDNEKSTMITTESSTYKVRLPNMPYFFFNGDVQLNWNNFVQKGNHLSVGYNNNYVGEFPLYWENHGNTNKHYIPKQFSHDVNLTYAIRNGRYNISLECRNLTDERLYDNFSLQKPGRAFYAKVRYFFNK